jgi:hypothetical protein
MVLGIFLPTAVYGGAFGNLLAQWEQFGVFAYLLPFLIIFSLIFVILNGIKIFNENRAVNAILALAVSLMALQFNFVPVFFSEIFPRLGVGLAIILVTIILLALFIDVTKPGIMYPLLGVGVIILIVILYNSAVGAGVGLNFALYQYWEEILTALFFFGAIALVVGLTNKNVKPYNAPLLQMVPQS